MFFFVREEMENLQYQHEPSILNVIVSRFDYDDGGSGAAATSSVNGYHHQNGVGSESRRLGHDSPGNFTRASPHYSSLSYSHRPSAGTHSSDLLPDHTVSVHRSVVASMPLFPGPSIIRSSHGGEPMRTPKLAPVSPPPRDPETTLSSSSSRGLGTDNYLAIYASPVRKRPPMDAVARSERNPGDLCTRVGGSGGGGDGLMGSINDAFFTSTRNDVNLAPRGLKSVSPQTGSGGGSHYSTNSLNRNLSNGSRHYATANGAGALPG